MHVTQVSCSFSWCLGVRVPSVIIKPLEGSFIRKAHPRSAPVQSHLSESSTAKRFLSQRGIEQAQLSLSLARAEAFRNAITAASRWRLEPPCVVSVIMAIYDGQAYLQYIDTAIESLLNQTFTNFELLIATDESTNPGIINAIESHTDKRIRRIHVPGNRNGLVRLLNGALANASGQYVVRFDADDENLPYRLERQVRFLDKHSSIGIVGSGYDIIDSAGRVVERPQPTLGVALIKWKLLFCDNPLANSTVMGRRVVLSQLGGYNPEVLYCEDYELWIRALKLTQVTNMPDT